MWKCGPPSVLRYASPRQGAFSFIRDATLRRGKGTFGIATSDRVPRQWNGRVYSKL